MKKTLYFAAGLLALAGCAKEIESPVVEAPRGTTVTIQTAVEKTKSTESAAVFSWQSNETISVGTSNAEYVTFDVADATLGTFSHTFTETAPTLLMAVSPEVSGSEVFAGTDEYQVSLPDAYDNYVPGTTNALMVGTPDPDTANKFIFRHVAALVKVTYANVPVGTQYFEFSANENMAGGVIELNSTDAEITNSNTSLSSDFVLIGLENPVSVANQTMSFYVPIATGDYTGVKVCLYDDEMDKIASSEKTLNKTLSLQRRDVLTLPTITLPAADLYRKVTQTSDLKEGGQYLIVYEDGSVAFDGSLDGLDAVSNTVAVEINSNTIASTSEIDASSFIISIENGTILSSSGYYIGVTSNSNGLKQNEVATTYNNTFSIDGDGNAVIVISGVDDNMTLRYNKASNQTRFRYYKNAGQEPIALYVKDNTGSAIVVKQDADIAFDPTSATVTYGEAFTQPTLSNEHNLIVSYASDNTDVATVTSEGVISIEGVGTAVITASWEEQTVGENVYRAGSTTFTLTVKAPATTYGSVDEPVSMSDVVDVIANLENKEITTDFYYVGGTVSVAPTSISSGKLTFSFTDGTNTVKAYNCLDLNEANFTSKDDVAVGDKVVVYGNLEKYNSDYEIVNCYLVKHIEGPAVSVTPDSKTVLAAGSTFNVTVSANCDWTITGDGFTASPSNGEAGDTEVAITVPARTDTGDGTITVTITADDDPAVTATVTITQHGTDYIAPTGWIRTDISDLATGDIIAIVDVTTAMAMSNNNGTSNAPAAAAVVLSTDKSKITTAPAETLQWVFETTTGGYMFKVDGTDNYLYVTATNNGVRVGSGDRNVFDIVENNNKPYLHNLSGTDNRYIGVYNNSDWRGYTSINSNIQGTETAFYKYFGEDTGSDPGTDPGTGGGSETTSVIYDFTGSDWSVSNGTLTNGTVSFTGAGNDNFKMNTGYFIMGKANAYITFPAYSKSVTKIEVTGKSGASASVVQNIFVGDTAVSTATTGATGTNTYEIASAYQAAGTIYKLKVTSSHNTQITKIEVFFGN